MRASLVIACVVASLAASAVPVRAEGGADLSAGENGRYSMTPTSEGFLRLDTRTGAVSLCKVENGAARCQAVAEERKALEDEIGRLARENETLRKKQTDGYGLPTRKDFDRAMNYAEEFMRRMMQIMRDETKPKDGA